jgi:hypothetical protein
MKLETINEHTLILGESPSYFNFADTPEHFYSDEEGDTEK